MFMGLSKPLSQGDLIDVTLTFEKAGEVTLQIPVDNDRAPAHGAGHGGGHTHGSDN
jgi:copper(I)-binding protein